MTKIVIQNLMNRPAQSIGAAVPVSATGTVVSFTETTLPIVQWVAGFIAILSGVVGLAVGLYHLRQIWIKERAKKK